MTTSFPLQFLPALSQTPLRTPSSVRHSASKVVEPWHGLCFIFFYGAEKR